MFRIKICGITNVDDARAAAAARADAIGLNFYRGSRRYINGATAERISISLPAGVKKVGVFVNAEANEIRDLAEQAQLNWVQLHGDEHSELLVELPHHVPILCAFRCAERGLAPLANLLAECRTLGRLPDAVLIDAATPGEFGGTGQAADWNRISADRNLLKGIPFILAGGLTHANVGQAIAAVRPDGVDVASGVERLPGRKDAALMQQFVAAAAAAFAGL